MIIDMIKNHLAEHNERGALLAAFRAHEVKNSHKLLALVDDAPSYRRAPCAAAIIELLRAGVDENSIPAALQGVWRILNHNVSNDPEVAVAAAAYLAAIAAITGPLDDHQWPLLASLLPHVRRLFP